MPGSIDTNALTLYEASLYSNEPLVRYIADSFIAAGSVHAEMKLRTMQARHVNGLRQMELPAIAWRAYNENPTIVRSSPTPYSAQLYTWANGIEIDHYFDKSEGQVERIYKSQLDNIIKSWAYDFNEAFFTNGSTSAGLNPKAPAGIRYMLDNPDVYGLNTSSGTAVCKINGGGVDMTTANMTAPSFNTMMQYIDTLLTEMDAIEGNNVCIFVNDDLYNRLFFGMRQFAGQGGFSQAEDQTGRMRMHYRNAKFLRAGRKRPQTTATSRGIQSQIITSTETNTGADGASTFTSAYICKFGEGIFDGWTWTPGTATISDPYSLNGGVTQQWTVHGGVGLELSDTRAIGRIFNIKIS